MTEDEAKAVAVVVAMLVGAATAFLIVWVVLA